MSPEKRYISKSGNHKAELYYWSGEFPIYIDNQLFIGSWDDAIREVDRKEEEDGKG